MKFLRRQLYKEMYRYHFSKYKYYLKMDTWVYEDYLDEITIKHNDEKRYYHNIKQKYYLGLYNDLT